MSHLISELKREHATILEQLRRARELGIEGTEGRAVLLEAKSLLLAHLAREDKELYPVLNEAATSRPALRFLLDMFGTDIQTVTRDAVAFFEAFESGGDPMKLSRDLGGLAARLKMRIASEEAQLYAEFDAVASPTARA